MATKIICLANSKKYGDRCVAGIKVKEIKKGKKGKKGFEVCMDDGKPRWIRPVSSMGHGEIPTSIAQDIQLLDVIKFDAVEASPVGYQSENVYFNQDSICKLSKIGCTSHNLDVLTHDYDTLFGNRGKAVHVEVIGAVDHSLVFIKVDDYDVFIKPNSTQLRIKFEYNFDNYDLPVTDINFKYLYQNNNDIVNNIDHLYLTISLAVEQNGWYSKLIAGVIYL